MAGWPEGAAGRLDPKVAKGRQADFKRRVQSRLRVGLAAPDGVRLVSWAMLAGSNSGYWLLIRRGNAGNIS